MHNQSSQIDELFRDASKQAELIPVEDNWDAFKSKLPKRFSVMNKVILWSSVAIFIGTVTVVAVLYFNPPKVKDAVNADKRINELQQPPQTLQSQGNSLNNNEQKIQKESQNTNTIPSETNETVNQNNNKNIPYYYKVLLGSFKDKPDENGFSKLGGNITDEYKNGVHKFYAGVYDNPTDAENKLNEIKALGFTDALVLLDHSTVNASTKTNSSNEETAIVYKDEPAKTDNSNALSFNSQQSSVQTNVPFNNKENAVSATTNNNNQQSNVKADVPININNKDNAVSANNNQSTPNITTVKTVADTAKAKENLVNAVTPSPKIITAFKRWAVGLSFSYDINNYHLVSNNNYGKALLDSSSGKLKGSNSFLYSVGVQITYRFSEMLTVETGILFSQKKPLSATGINYGSNLDYSFNYNGKYFDIPIRARYYFINNPVRVYATAGALLSSNFPVKNKSYFKLENPQDSGYYELVTIQPASIGVSMQVGAGVEYILKNKIRLYLSPIYNYSFSPVLKQANYNNEPVKHFINGFNIAAGCYFDL